MENGTVLRTQGNMNQTIFQPTPLDLSFAKILETGESVKLVYVHDSQEGIVREKSGDTFIYRYKGRKITDKKELARIRKLAIPPAWTDVWICRKPNGHIQAIGFDV